LAFAGLQGYQRIYRIAGLGDFISHHIMKLKLAYNYENAYNDTIYFATTDVIDASYYGEGYYGEEVVYGGVTGTSFEWRHKPTIQKCESIKVRLEDIDTIGVNGGGSASLVSLTFVVGIKGGINRMGASNTIGNG
jgi:hypothetical protein